MNRKTLYLSLAAALVLALGTPIVNACDGETKCDVERKCEKSETGVRCTITAKGETTADQVRECVRKCAGSADHAENVTVTFEDIEGGVVVVKTGADEKTIEALQAKAEGCAKAAEAGKACCSKAHAAKAVEGKDCPHGAEAAANHKDCPHATKSGGCTKAKTADDA